MVPAILALTLLELLLVLLIIAVLAALLIPKILGGTATGASSAPIPYPPLPTGTTPGAVAAGTFAQGAFADNVTQQRRLTRETYTFRRYDFNYTWSPQEKDRDGIIIRFDISAVSSTDRPKIVGVSGTSGSRILTDTNALVITGSDGVAEIEVEMPPGESSTPNTLKIMVEELPDATGDAIRRIFHTDVEIVPF
jgi:hypothetical protein